MKAYKLIPCLYLTPCKGFEKMKKILKTIKNLKKNTTKMNKKRSKKTN